MYITLHLVLPIPFAPQFSTDLDRGTDPPGPYPLTPAVTHQRRRFGFTSDNIFHKVQAHTQKANPHEWPQRHGLSMRPANGR
jgi:hypothetical protein